MEGGVQKRVQATALWVSLEGENKWVLVKVWVILTDNSPF